MIIVKISGGLGNQLLQYAFAKSLQQRRQIKIKIDASGFQLPIKNITPRKFLLDKFNISLETATRDDFHKIKIPYPLDRSLSENIYRIIFKIREFLRLRGRKKIMVDHDLNFNESIFNIRDDSYVTGIWTNQKYFNNIREIILKELTLKSALGEKAAELLKEIKKSVSVSAHIRRGDYLKHTHKVAILTEDYYQKAVNIIKNSVGERADKTFFIFSDDIEYVKAHYADIFGENAVYVSGDGIADYEELWLMSKCEHNIMANSSFSWWGAWLNQNPNKIVIAPKRYRSDGRDMSDFLPKEYIIT